ncbi:MAG: WYL domain-containing protein, partial [Bacteroidota bacterium]
MPANRNALIRYRTIDKCLQNRYRKWTLDDLIEVVSETLYDYEGIDKGVSKRTVQMDIQMMRSDKLGYNAPIVVVDRKYYTYEDADYSITNIPLTDQDLGKLTETVDFLKQFKGFSHFRELEGMVQKLEDHVYSQKTQQKPVIDFEKNDHLKGLEFLDVLYQAIVKEEVLRLSYQSFKARASSEFLFYPYLLKEFKNRWFLIGIRRAREGYMNLALDRIIQVDRTGEPFIKTTDFDPEQYFKNVIGVSVSPTLSPEEVVLWVTHKHAPYVLTKPLHHSQKELERDNFGVTISIAVQHNFELEKEILAFGDGIKVISPIHLKRNIKSRLQRGVELYSTEISEGGLETAHRKLIHKGSCILSRVYSNREVILITKLLKGYFDSAGFGKTPHATRELLKKIPQLKNVLLNRNLRKVLSVIDKEAFLVKAMYFDKPVDSNWYVTWHQDTPINVREKIETPGYSSWTSRDGVVSVLPPERINQNRFAVRIHLDDADQDNGALRVIHGSHQRQ